MIQESVSKKPVFSLGSGSGARLGDKFLLQKSSYGHL